MTKDSSSRYRFTWIKLQLRLWVLFILKASQVLKLTIGIIKGLNLKSLEVEFESECLPALMRLKTHGVFCVPSSLSAQQSSWAFRWVEVRKASCSRKIEDTFLSLWATVVCWTSLRWFRSFVVVGDAFDKESIQWNLRLDDGTLSTMHCTGTPLSGFTTTGLLFTEFTGWLLAGCWWCGLSGACFEENSRLSLWAWLCTWWWRFCES